MRTACVLALVGVVVVADLSAQEFPAAPKNPYGRLFVFDGTSRPTVPFPAPARSTGVLFGAGAETSGRTVVCGMTLVPVEPAIDARIQFKLPATGAKTTIRTVAPAACR